MGPAQPEESPLHRVVERLKRSNVALRAENDLLLRFFSRLDPKQLGQSAGDPVGPGAGRPEHVLILEEADIFLADIRKARSEVERDESKEKKAEVHGTEHECKKKKKAKVLKETQNKDFVQYQQNQMMEEEETQDWDLSNDLELIEQRKGFYSAEQKLDSNKKKLYYMSMELEQLNSDKNWEMQMIALEDVEKPFAALCKAITKEQALNEWLCRRLAEYSGPDVFEYVEVKEKLKMLQRRYGSCQRKVEIAEMWNRQKAAAVSRAEAAAKAAIRFSTLKFPKIADARASTRQLSKI